MSQPSLVLGYCENALLGNMKVVFVLRVMPVTHPMRTSGMRMATLDLMERIGVKRKSAALRMYVKRRCN